MWYDGEMAEEEAIAAAEWEAKQQQPRPVWRPRPASSTPAWLEVLTGLVVFGFVALCLGLMAFLAIMS
jgi:hypothetical protein